jgi:uncharacterized cupredoxin-like copper-binding protein
MQRTVIGFLMAAMVVTGCGGGDDDDQSSSPVPPDQAKPARTIDVMMRDIHYEPAAVTVNAGETVTFRFINEGEIVHDAYIGDEASQERHEKEMRGDSHHGKKGGGISVEPGKTGSITHTFSRAGTTIIGCHEPGHYAGGMKVTVTVA